MSDQKCLEMRRVMRTITTDTIIQNIKEMCIEANYSLTSDVKEKFTDCER